MDLLDDVIQEVTMWFWVCYTLCLKESDLLGRDCVGSGIKFLVTDMVSTHNDESFIVFPHKLKV